ncbi:hypothetical protein [Paenibacillus abyssi]|nr:hypothetical protein [Paenibacillus abyssi]
MFKPGFILSTDAHIAAAIHERTTITAWIEGKLTEDSGMIESQNEATVKINGVNYVKAECEFRVK